MMWQLIVDAAWAQDADATISPEAVTWLGGLAAVGVGLGGVGAGAYALYRFFLRPSVLEDVQAITAPLAEQLQRLEVANAEMQRIALETWGTKERGLLADLLRLADGDLLRRVSELEASRDQTEKLVVSHYEAIHADLAEMSRTLKGADHDR